MKFTQVAADAFQKIQLNAGVLLIDFDPLSGALDRNNIFGATGGGASFKVTPTYTDFGEGIDNIPANTMELKRLDNVTAVMSGTMKTADTEVASRLIGAADVDMATGKITPRADLLQTDFNDLWWVGDYSDVNTGDDAGFIAIHLINALSTGGFSLQSNDKDKGDFAFEFTGHYSLADTTVLPYEIYIKQGGEQPSPTPTADTALASLTIGALTLDPEFAPEVTEYSATTTNATNTVTAVASDEAATVTITVNDEPVESGSSATWDEGENTVLVIVANGGERSTYSVTVTKE